MHASSTRKARDEFSEARALHFLRLLGCPGVRRGQGSTEWQLKRGKYTKTPDLLAGPIDSGGAPTDFLIDVFAPTGDWYRNPLAGDPVGAKLVGAAMGRLNSTTRFNLDALEAGLANFYAPINKKVNTYSASRSYSPMLGIVMYIEMQTADADRPEMQLAFMHSLSALDRGFGLTHHCGDQAITTLLQACLQPFTVVQALVLPFPANFGFLLWAAEPGDTQKSILLINGGVVHQDFEWRRHPVIKWLGRFATTPPMKIVEQVERRRRELTTP